MFLKNYLASLVTAVKGILRCLSPAKVDILTQIPPVSRSFGTDRGTPIDRFLRDNRRFICGDVLEVSEDRYSTPLGIGLNSVFLLNGKQGLQSPTISADLTDPALVPERQFDCFVCTQTLNFVFEVQQAVVSVHRYLKPGGKVLCAVTGGCQISKYDIKRRGDYWRFTDLSIRKLFTPVFGTEVTVHQFGNLVGATGFLHRMAVEDLPRRELLDTVDEEYPLVIGIIATRNYWNGYLR